MSQKMGDESFVDAQALKQRLVQRYRDEAARSDSSLSVEEQLQSLDRYCEEMRELTTLVSAPNLSEYVRRQSEINFRMFDMMRNVLLEVAQIKKQAAVDSSILPSVPR